MDKEARYREIDQALSGILSSPIPFESALVSLIALLKEKLNVVSWVGFYRLVGETLWIGPYQGKIACLEVPVGKGVCGVAMAQKKSVLVPNVDEFPGHIACDSLSRSELVVPVKQRGKYVGVLDLDSHALAAFNQIDQIWIERLLNRIELF